MNTFKITSDSSRIVYTADPDNDGTFDLYSATFSGDKIQLNAPLVSGDRINPFEVTESSEYVVYKVYSDPDNANLFSVPIDGGVPTPLNQSGESVKNFQLSPDGEYVVYLRGYPIYSELHSIPVTGEGNNILLDSDGSLDIYTFSPDGNYVVYAFDDYIYSVPVVGGQRTQLANNIVQLRFLQISPDSQFVVFVNDYFGGQTPDLYQSPITGGAAIQLNGTIPVTSLFTWLGSYLFIEISPDGRYVVFVGDEEAKVKEQYLFAIYSVPIIGGDVTKVSDTLTSAGNDGSYPLYYDGFEISHDSYRIIYAADHDTDEVFELFSVPIVGGNAEKLNQPLTPGGDIWNFDLIPNSSRVIYRADQETDDVVELFVGFALVARPDSYVVRQDSSINVAAPGVLENDLQGGMATAVLFTPPAHGNLTFNPDGSFTYTPDTEYWGTDSFTYLAHEEGQDSDAVTATVVVVKDWLYFPMFSKQ